MSCDDAARDLAQCGGRRWRGLTLPAGPVGLALPLAYFHTAVLAIKLSGYSGNIAAFWLGGALLTAALLRHDTVFWPALLTLAGCADVAANLLMGSSPKITFVVAPLDVLEGLIVAAGMRRFQTAAPWYGSVRNISLFGFFIVAACSASSLLGSLWLNHLGVAPFAETWRLWAAADVLGLVIVTPFLLSWTDKALQDQRSARKLGELVALSLAVATVTVLIFTTALPIAFLVFPFLALLTLRTGLSGATAGVAILALVGVSLTMQGMGPIAGFPNLELLDQIGILQLYIFAATLTSLPIAVILAQRTALAINLSQQAAISDVALENMAQGLSMFDAEQRLITCNGRYLEIYDVPSHLGAPGTTHRDIITQRLSTMGDERTFEEYCSNNDLDTRVTTGAHLHVGKRLPLLFPTVP